MVAAVIGRPKAFAYVGLVAIFSVVSGYLYGAWVDGASLPGLLAGLSAFVALLVGLIGWLHRRSRHAMQPT
jgi:hypothetical protein